MAKPEIRFLDRSTPPHLFTLVAVTACSAMTMTMFLPSMASMAVYFETEYWVVQLAVTLYLAGNAMLQLVVGPMSDYFGRRPVLLGSFAIFIGATIGCLLSTSIGMFLVFRMTQAAIVAGLVLSRAVVRDIHDAAQSASMIGWVTMSMSIVPLLGPALGGWLDGYFGWQGSFGLMLLCALALTALVWFDLGETARSRGRPLSAQIAEYPELLRAPRFWGYAICSALSSGCYFAFLGSASLVGANVFGMSPAHIGMALGAPALGFACGNFLSGRFSTSVGINRMVLMGTIVCTAGLVLDLALTLAGHGGPAVFFGFVVLMAMGNGMTLPNCVAGVLSVRPRLAGSASGLGGALQIAGGAFMAALASRLLGDAENGPAPLLWVMACSSAASIGAIVFVILRTRARGLPL